MADTTTARGTFTFDLNDPARGMTVVHDGLRIDFRPMRLEDMRKGKKTRAYVSYRDADIPMPRPGYGSKRGDGSDDDKAWRAYNRAEVKAMRKVLGEAEPVLRALLGSTASSWVWTFSRTAGCSCPCSPGMVLDGQLTWKGRPVEVWVAPEGDK